MGKEGQPRALHSHSETPYALFALGSKCASISLSVIPSYQEPVLSATRRALCYYVSREGRNFATIVYAYLATLVLLLGHRTSLLELRASTLLGYLATIVYAHLAAIVLLLGHYTLLPELHASTLTRTRNKDFHIFAPAISWN
ncbi:hypothetical protein NDU88_004150 [Pleurodeles waltl]|uniref:Uncharacterized protein n=1 Tax=Pleurodeles waltl TaxID=8319 RepID=A0AAV7W7F3_PLEWA|nr:hypothetical protein NDU88_004150 [Pleurodeles waltl]